VKSRLDSCAYNSGGTLLIGKEISIEDKLDISVLFIFFIIKLFFGFFEFPRFREIFKLFFFLIVGLFRGGYGHGGSALDQ